MAQTKIEWTATYHADGSVTPGFTINPIKFRLRQTGRTVNMCTVCSPGCENCYSQADTRRWWPKKEGKFPGYTARALKLGEFVLKEEKLQEVLRRREPTKYFWCDMTDLFHPSVPFELVDQCFAVMALTDHHTHQILTKRPERLAKYLNAPQRADHIYGDYFLRTASVAPRPTRHSENWGSIDPNYHVSHPLARWNWWLGTSVENQKAADKRIPKLLQCPAAVRFLSCEPLIGPVRLPESFLLPDFPEDDPRHTKRWVIVGGESGFGARPMVLGWAKDLVRQCQDFGVAVFVKQVGSRPTNREGERCPHVRDWKGGNPDEWPAELRVREFPRTYQTTVSPAAVPSTVAEPARSTPPALARRVHG